MKKILAAILAALVGGALALLVLWTLRTHADPFKQDGIDVEP